jgi:hypothetical protein
MEDFSSPTKKTDEEGCDVSLTSMYSALLALVDKLK